MDDDSPFSLPQRGSYPLESLNARLRALRATLNYNFLVADA